MELAFSRMIPMLLPVFFCSVYGHRNGTPAGIEYHIPEGGSKALNCSQAGAPSVQQWQNVTWVLPDLTLLQHDGLNVILDGTTFTLSNDGQILLVNRIQPEWYGEYYCMVLYNENTYLRFYVMRFGLNTSYYYATELWYQYKHMVIILGVTSGTVLGLLILVFSLIIWCKRTSRRPSDQNASVPDRRAPQPRTTIKNHSIWKEYLEGSDPDGDHGNAFPGSDKTL